MWSSAAWLMCGTVHSGATLSLHPLLVCVCDREFIHAICLPFCVSYCLGECMYMRMACLSILDSPCLPHIHCSTFSHTQTWLECKAGQDGRRRVTAPVLRGRAGNRRISSEDSEHASPLCSLSPRIRWKTSTALIAFHKHIALSTHTQWGDLFCRSNLHKTKEEKYRLFFLLVFVVATWNSSSFCWLAHPPSLTVH